MQIASGYRDRTHRLSDRLRLVSNFIKSESVRRNWIAHDVADSFAGYIVSIALRTVVHGAMPRFQLHRLAARYPEDVLTNANRLKSGYVLARGASLLRERLRHATPTAVDCCRRRYGLSTDAAQFFLSCAVAGVVSALVKTKSDFKLDLDELGGVIRCESTILARMHPDAGSAWRKIKVERNRPAVERIARRLIKAFTTPERKFAATQAEGAESVAGRLQDLPRRVVLVDARQARSPQSGRNRAAAPERLVDCAPQLGVGERLVHDDAVQFGDVMATRLR